MNKFKATLYIHQNNYDSGYFITESDMTEHGYVLLDVQEVELYEPSANPIEAEIEMLNKQIEVVEQDSHNKITAIKQRKASLLAIENKG